jgi:hypothetical protein
LLLCHAAFLNDLQIRKKNHAFCQVVCYDFDKRKECPSKKTQGDFLTRGFSWLDSQSKKNKDGYSTFFSNNRRCCSEGE